MPTPGFRYVYSSGDWVKQRAVRKSIKELTGYSTTLKTSGLPVTYFSRTRAGLFTAPGVTSMPTAFDEETKLNTQFVVNPFAETMVVVALPFEATE
jgi:hypothetical protein